MVKWDTGENRNCFHFNPKGFSEPNTEKKMSHQAKKRRDYDIQWGVVNPGNALCAGIFATKREAEWFRKTTARAYVVVKVVITPIYTERSFFDGVNHG